MTVHQDVLTALRTVLLGVSGLPVARAWQNIAFEPEPGVPYVRDTMLLGAALPVEVGGGAAFRAEEVYQVDVFTPAGGPITGTLGVADAIASAFRSGTITAGGRKVWVRSCRLGPWLIEDGWCQVPVSLFYTVDH